MSKVRRLKKWLRKVKRQCASMERLTDEELSHVTEELKQELAKGKTLEQILPVAFAAICEADRRILGKFPYDVQILGGIALHFGYLTEMNTGEGKTLTATMPLYLNALTGKSVLLVTTNAYLALRDAKEMGQVYQFMGLTVAAGVSEKEEEKIENSEKKQIYDSDIVYTTHSVLGFDYLLNNLVTKAEDRFMREFYYVIIDEADSVLLDSAQTPLVISGSPRVQSNLYEMADFFVTTLEENVDYEVEDKMVWLTDAGVRYAESYFQIDNFYGEEYFQLNRHVVLALRAHALFEQEKEYVVSSKGEIMLLDNGTGRMMPGVKLRGGLHQALEAKEKLKLSMENRSVASVTFQNLFLLFPKMSGMSGTIADAAEELLSVYGRKVVVIPPNCPVKRKDRKDLYYRDSEEQYEKALELALKLHETGQPVLIVVSTIPETEAVSRRLVKEAIPHNVLNANNAYWEASIIQEAGQMYAVTVATGMAGRGTDIKLGEGVRELGGLAVIGIGRMKNVRLERQARGRAGRQGDPGMSRFFVSLQDEVVVNNYSPKRLARLEKKWYIGKRRLKKFVDKSQNISEEFAVMSRRQAMNYDEVLQRQRKLIYEMRNNLLDGKPVSKERIMEIAKRNIQQFLQEQNGAVDQSQVNRYVLDHISYRLDHEMPGERSSKKEWEQALLELVSKRFDEQEESLGGRKRMDAFVRAAILHAIDEAWVEQVDYLQQLQAVVSGRAFAQRNLIYEYQEDALESFQKMEKMIDRNMMRNVLLSSVEIEEEEQMEIVFP